MTPEQRQVKIRRLLAKRQLEDQVLGRYPNTWGFQLIDIVVTTIEEDLARLRSRREQVIPISWKIGIS